MFTTDMWVSVSHWFEGTELESENQNFIFGFTSSLFSLLFFWIITLITKKIPKLWEDIVVLFCSVNNNKLIL